jgi:hypothetical protein
MNKMLKGTPIENMRGRNRQDGYLPSLNQRGGSYDEME